MIESVQIQKELCMLSISTFSASSSANTSQTLTFGDWIQLLLVVGTFLAVLVALFKDWFWERKNKPQIEVCFEPKNPEFFHITNMDILNKEGQIITSIPTYYIRLKISNLGKSTMDNTEVVLEKVEPTPDRFMSLNLSWAGFILAPNDIARTVRIPHKQSRIVDVIEVMEPEATAAFAAKLESEKNKDAERYKKYMMGFRSASIKPNSFSDIFPAGEYLFYLGIYADNTEPKFVKLSIKYDGSFGNEGIEGMRRTHLKVSLK